MEDLIYLIILIAWAVFAFYRQSQKKKAAARAAQARPEAPEPEPEPTTRSWEEILFGEEEVMETEPEPMPQEEPERWPGRSARGPVSLEQMYMQRRMESLEDPRVQRRLEEEKKGLPEEVEDSLEPVEEREHLLKDFDLRKAIIYSEILRRPYD